MKRYKKYKDSGVEWIGEIPEGWEIKKLKYVADASPSNIDKKSKDNEEVIFLCNYVDVYKNEFISSKISFMKATANEDQIRKFILEKGDVIATKDSETPDDIATTALVVEDLDNVVCGYHLTHIKPESINGEYLFRFFQTNYLNSYFKVSANGVTRYGLGVDKFNSALILNPPKSEQTIIANYLDRKTAEIDQLITQKERLLKLYEEEKTAIINQEVTQGINPDVKLKDSGIDWLGKILEHWEIKKMKYLTTVLKDGTHGSFTRVLNGYRLLSVRNIKGDSFDFLDDDSKISKIDFLTITKPFKVSENDIQLAIVGATLGKVAIVPKLDEEFATQRSVATIRTNPNCMETKYQFYFLKSDFFQNYLWVNAGFSAQPGVYLGALEDCHIPVPSLKEQTSIVQHIETETARINAKINKTKKIIALQKEYRTALISEVVTGKIKVAQEVV